MGSPRVRSWAAAASWRRSTRFLWPLVVSSRSWRSRVNLASGRPPANEAVAGQLEVAAGLAVRRGAPDAAAELMDLAIGLTPRSFREPRAERKLSAARYWFDAGDLGRAQSLLDEVVAEGPAGNLRARALTVLAQLHFRRNSFTEAFQAASHARQEAADLELQIRSDLDLAFYAVSLADFPSTLLHSRAAAQALPADAAPALVADVLAVATIAEFICGRGLDEAQLERSLQLEDRSVAKAWQMQPSFIASNIYLYTGRPEKAVPILGDLYTYAIDSGAENIIPLHCLYLIEALIELGRLGQAQDLLGWVEARARRLDRALALAVAGRCRALLFAAIGDMESALAAMERAMAQHDRIDMPVERGRTLLAWGRVLRRAGRRAQAKRVLTEAVDVFEQTGTLAWAERAEAELSRLGGKRTGPGQLTPTETLVADLAISGLSNQEISERAFLTVKAVEANLTRVYRKLGIRSRGGLARALETTEPADG